MPFYEFQCPCGHVEVRSSMGDAGKARHCAKGHPLTRVWAVPRVQVPDPGGNDFLNRVASGNIDERDLHGMNKDTARKTALQMAHDKAHPKEATPTPTGSGIDKFYT